MIKSEFMSRALCAALVAAPIAVAEALSGDGVHTDYAPEWWAVFAVTAVSTAGLAVMMLADRSTASRTAGQVAAAAIACAAVYETVLGLCQLAGLTPSAHSLFPMTGTFYNPGPYGGFVAMGLPVGLSMALDNRRGRQWIGWITLTLILTVLPASASRSAWIAAVAGCCLVALGQRREAVTEWLRRWWLPLTAAMIAAAIGAYMLKADSADGRLLMWRIGLRACAAHPWGVGWHHVAGAYGDAQEAYFASGAASPDEIAVAGTPDYLFNEYLQVALAWGWPAWLLFAGGLATAIVSALRARIYATAGATATFAVFAFSSYPLQFPLFVAAITMLTVSAAAGICRTRGATCLFAAFCTVICLTSGISAYSHYETARTYKRWERVRHHYRMSDHRAAVEAMSSFGDSLAWNRNYLFEFGHSLNLTGDYEKSNRVLAEAAKVCGDPMIFNIRGKNYQALGLRDSALAEFRRAYDRLPNRMYPHYLMMRLATDCEPVDTGLAVQEARIVLGMHVKVMSPAVHEMRDSARAALKEFDIFSK